MLFGTLLSLSQEKKWCIRGTVFDNNTNEPISFVHVALYDMSKGTITSENGEFELCLDIKDTVIIQFFHTAYNPYKLTILPTEKESIKVRLETRKYSTQEVKVKGNQHSMVKGIIPGKIVLKQKDVLLTPTILGAPDVVRTLQLMPGIQSVNEGNSGIYVRGGSPGQNYIVFDDIELMNPSHLMGIYSVFNPLLVDEVDFYKGNAPLHLSSRLASSIIVKTRSSLDTTYNWAGNLGNISSNITYQGMSKDQKWYTNIGFRRSYLEVLQAMAKPFMSDERNYFENNKFNFYDFNGKIRYRNGASTVQLSWYKGQDLFKFSNNRNAVKLDNIWGNEGIALKWNYLIGSSLSMNNSVSYSSYKSSLNIDFVDQSLKFKTDYHHYQFKNGFFYQRKNKIYRWGVHVTHKYISPQDIDVSLNTNSTIAYNSYKHMLVKFPLSVRLNEVGNWEYYIGGAIEYYKLLEREQTLNNFTNGNSSETFHYNGLVTANYKLDSNQSIKTSYSFVSQNIHLTSIASIPLPSDVWMPATEKVPAELGHQLTLGFFKEIPGNGIQIGVEGYAKYLNNTLMLKVNVEEEENENFEDNFFKGDAKAYGIEITIKKEDVKYNTNISYTLGYTKQRFEDLNEGKWHDAKYDRRHDLNVLASYKLNDRIEFGGSFVFATGNKATLPKGRYWMMGDISSDYEGINNYRMPVYHRLDLSLNYRLNSKIFKESILNFSIINVLNRSNPYFIYYYIDEGSNTYELTIDARQVSLFPVMPSIGWRYKF